MRVQMIILKDKQDGKGKKWRGLAKFDEDRAAFRQALGEPLARNDIDNHRRKAISYLILRRHRIKKSF